MNAKISIVKTTSNIEPTYMEIIIRSETGQQKIKLTMSDFAELVTGKQIDCEKIVVKEFRPPAT